MADEKTRLRPAKPERDEGLVFARYLDQAAEGFFGFMLGRQAASIIADAYAELGHSLSYEHVVFAERDGVIVGMSLAYTSEQHREFSDEPLERAAGRVVRRMKMTRLLLAPLWRILETVPEGDFYLQAIAVDLSSEERGSARFCWKTLSSVARATVQRGSRLMSPPRTTVLAGCTRAEDSPSPPNGPVRASCRPSSYA